MTTETVSLSGETISAHAKDSYEHYLDIQAHFARQAAWSIDAGGGTTDDVELFLATFLPHTPNFEHPRDYMPHYPDRYTAPSYLRDRLEKAKNSLGLIAVSVFGDALDHASSGGIVSPNQASTHTSPRLHIPRNEHFVMRMEDERIIEGIGRKRVGFSAHAEVCVRVPEESNPRLQYKALTIVYANGSNPFGLYDPRLQHRVLFGMAEIQASNISNEWKERCARWADMAMKEVQAPVALEGTL